MASFSKASSDLMGLFVGTPWTPVGHDEVIKMEYWIWIGRLGAGPEILLAHTTSYKLGVSVSEIKWGFYNPSESGAKDTSSFEFTLHDIAGQTISNFLRIKTGNYMIYFRGPTSSGFPWWGSPVVYHPTADKCDLQFSQTQGFTYRFSAVPAGKMAESKNLATHSKLHIDGLNEANKAHSNTFKDYLLEVETKWNKMLSEMPEKAVTTKIKLTMDPKDAANDWALKLSPVLTERENKGQELKRDGDPSALINPIMFNQFDSIAAVLKRLWQERFVAKEGAPGAESSSRSHLEVSFARYEEGTLHVNVKCHRSDTTDSVPNTKIVCVGTDKYCNGYPYRAQISAINFKGLLSSLAENKIVVPKGTGPMDASQQGNDANEPIQHEKEKKVQGETQTHTTVANLEHHPGIGGGANPMYDGWGEFRTLKSIHKKADFTIDLDMPYTFAFSPHDVGGLLKDAVSNNPMGAIDWSEGIYFLFWWYTTPHCQDMMLVRELEGEYRIAKIQHSIGLSGNSTQLTISHLTNGV